MQGDYTAPIWRGMETLQVGNSSGTVTGRSLLADAASMAPSTEYIPPHLRGVARGGTATQSSVSNPYEETVASPGAVGKRRTPFNAWGPGGQHEIHYRQSSGITTPATTRAPTSPPATSAANKPSPSGYVPPHLRPQITASTSTSTAGQAAAARNNPNWAKAVSNTLHEQIFDC